MPRTGGALEEMISFNAFRHYLPHFRQCGVVGIDLGVSFYLGCKCAGGNATVNEFCLLHQMHKPGNGGFVH